MIVAVTLDIVSSRSLADRVEAQRMLDATIAGVARDFPVPGETLRPTVGDEQQGTFVGLDDALAWLLLLRLALPEGLDCRFGVGIGETIAIPSTTGSIPEGSAWWAAREAIDLVHGMARRAAPHARTWIAAAADAPASVHAELRFANAYTLARDEIVGSMGPRARRLTYGRCLGVTQRELAETEGITQSAVSQTLGSSGARGLIAGFRALRSVFTPG